MQIYNSFIINNQKFDVFFIKNFLYFKFLSRSSFHVNRSSFNLLTTLADRDPQGTTRIRATCDLSLLVLSKAMPFLVKR